MTAASRDPLAAAPGPCPWYMGPRSPRVEGHRWARAGESDAEAGKVLLRRGGAVVLVIEMYAYVQTLPGPDLSWEWPTRVARDPRTGRIRGDGIRIAPFTLDESLRRLA